MTDTSREKIQATALKITRWVGSPASIVLHTLIFIASFFSVLFGLVEFDKMLLVLTTIVSLEAIYLSIFIQMTINYTTEAIEEVSQDIDEIQEDVEEMQEDVAEMQEDVGEIAEDVEEIQGDVDELQEDVEEMSEEEDTEDSALLKHEKTLAEIQAGLQKLMHDVEKLQSRG